jgi:hypothetical protein
MRWLSTSLLVLFGLLAGCAPTTQGFSSPTFRLIQEGSGLIRLNPPGVGNGAATFRLVVEVSNPNPFALQVAGIDGDLFLNGRRAASGTFPSGFALASRGNSRQTLEISVPLRETVPLLTDLARLIVGDPIAYRFDGTLTLTVFGLSQRLPTVTLVEGTLSQPFRLQRPAIAFDGANSGLRSLTLQRAVIDVAFVMENSTPLGYLFEAPELTLSLAGVPVATTRLVSRPVPAFSSTTELLQFELRTADLGLTLLNRLRGLATGSSLSASLGGQFMLVLPGLTEQSFDLADIVSGRL